MAEQWDVYDVNRQRTGRIIERPSAWGQEAYHLIIHVAIFDANHRMLIQRRSPRKHAWADLWDISSGGSALAGEESWQAAERETLEELGVQLNLKDIRPHFTINYTRGFDDFYTVETDDLDLSSLKLQDSEVAEVKWASHVCFLSGRHVEEREVHGAAAAVAGFRSDITFLEHIFQ